MAKNDAAVLVVGAGNFYTAAVGTARPASLSTPPSSPWENIGHTSLEDIVTFTSEGGEGTTLGTLQSKALRTTFAPRIESFNINLQQFDRRSLKFYFGSNSTVETVYGDLQVPQSPAPTEVAFLAIFVDGTNYFGLYAPKAEIFRSTDVAVGDAESLVSLPLSIKPVVYSVNDWTYSLTPLGGIAATGATAGTPGSYTPDGADLPLTVAGMSGITADPTSAWTSGQYVLLEDGTKANWDGSAWAAGEAS